MFRTVQFIFTLFLSTALFAQDSLSVEQNAYLEDQFYIGFTYNLLLNKPETVTQQNLSYGFQAGFIKDIPLNKERNFGIGIGLGYAVNSYYTNIQAVQTADGITYRVFDEDFAYKRNKIETHLVEMPLEIRWRNSTATEYRFWRIYTGFKLGYVVGSRSKLVADNFKDSFYNRDTENFRYGVVLNVGYNTFNIHLYYSLNDFFEDNTTLDTGEALALTPMSIGIIFYIL
ncbi:PorT family protein [Flavobacteriaceae bacterium D16]|nr:PorT family protein [Flavobacteriaceae bacterium D16]